MVAALVDRAQRLVIWFVLAQHLWGIAAAVTAETQRCPEAGMHSLHRAARHTCMWPASGLLAQTRCLGEGCTSSAAIAFNPKDLQSNSMRQHWKDVTIHKT